MIGPPRAASCSSPTWRPIGEGASTRRRCTNRTTATLTTHTVSATAITESAVVTGSMNCRSTYGQVHRRTRTVTSRPKIAREGVSRTLARSTGAVVAEYRQQHHRRSGEHRRDEGGLPEEISVLRAPSNGWRTSLGDEAVHGIREQCCRGAIRAPAWSTLLLDITLELPQHRHELVDVQCERPPDRARGKPAAAGNGTAPSRLAIRERSTLFLATRAIHPRRPAVRPGSAARDARESSRSSCDDPVLVAFAQLFVDRGARGFALAPEHAHDRELQVGQIAVVGHDAQ